ncbi:non-ribosomal peptide synthetase [Streptomyces fradiae]|uniref:non-ribosomal peptide synthetase n=1 Tax=Streptomyces fradiae TaxID=1906 RepID=UPI002942902D|nr:non-ribosomal peptide synthetase [Streptomyces fradiae]WOI61867.1 non-ribosomal peptide synthetase [Streptomyces fradiae]
MSHTTILRHWADHVEKEPDAVALATPSGDWTRRRLAAHAAGVRARLADGEGPVLVACAEPAPVIAAILACAATGRTFAPVDTRQPAARWAAVFEDLRPTAVVADRAGRAALAGLRGTYEGTVRFIDAEDAQGPQDAGDAPAAGAAESAGGAGDGARRGVDRGAPGTADAGYVYFTSGTTGRPKGIRGSLEAVEHFLDWETAEFGIGPGTRVSLLTSPGFDAFLRDTLLPLRAGGSVHAPAPGAVPVGASLAAWLDEQRIEVLHCVPTVFRTLRAAGLTAGSLPALRTVFLAGEPVRPSDIAWWHGLFGDGKTLVNLYGPSETTMTKVYRRLGPEDATAGTVPAGTPMPGVEVRVLAAGESVTGAIGEIEIHTPFPLRGYLDGRPGGFTGPRSYRTGDLGRLREDGALEVLGRRDQQVKVNGVRVELGEVEEVLRRHPGVRDVCAAAVAEDGADPALCAYVVADAAVTDEDLRAHATAGLHPGSHPSLYVRLSAIPRTLNGKADRRALPPPSAVRAATADDAPRDGAEAEIAALWCELLHLSAVGRRDSFTLLGGDSLAIARLLDRLRSRFGVDVPLRVFADDPTVAGLAAAVTGGSGR